MTNTATYAALLLVLCAIVFIVSQVRAYRWRILVRRVREAYANGLENNYQISAWTAEELACDMRDCCSDLEDESVSDICAAIKFIREGH